MKSYKANLISLMQNTPLEAAHWDVKDPQAEVDHPGTSFCWI